MALDRPPRGSGVYIVVSGAERLIVIALQIGARQRKDDLRQISIAWLAQGRPPLTLEQMKSLCGKEADPSRSTRSEPKASEAQ